MNEYEFDIKKSEIREQYLKIIKLKEFGLISSTSNCENEILGYSLEELKKIPQEANLALGCSNPKLYANYKIGETVLDLGCGAGFDCFLASFEVGKTGKVIGVDMMPEMLTKAREIAHIHNYSNVEFRLGEIEHLPVEDNSIDVIISNCVLNLSPNKTQAIKECKRVMKNSARLFLFDILLDDSFTQDMIQELQNNKAASCIKSAITVQEMQKILESENFKNISISLHAKSNEIIDFWLKEESKKYYNKVFSAKIEAYLE